MTQRWKLTIEYDGTDFVGWQRQAEDISVQSILEEAVHGFSGETVRAHVAGRTDAGVHALGQVAHIDLEGDFDEKTVRDAINFHMRPHQAAVLEAEAVSDEFHARFKAQKRTYCYRILMGRPAPPVIDERYVWHFRSVLDVEAMRAGAKHLLGEHDFSSFRAAECQSKTPIKSMERLDWIVKEGILGSGTYIELWAEAKSFLHHQIRNIVGSLTLVGMGKIPPDDIKKMLDAKDRTAAGPKAPATGLFFMKVNY